ncbi:MAG: lectin-like protein, partial [Synechococcus sp.]|nr:lectin-like protein [Synechococcus sp.]
MTSSNPIIRGNSIYTIVDGPSWTEAEVSSVKLGGHLTTIENEEENIFLQSSSLVSSLGEDFGVWIGLSRKNGWMTEEGGTDGDWKWTTGELYGSGNQIVGWNTNFFASGDGMGDEAVHMYTNENKGSWNDVPLSWSSSGKVDSGIAEIPFIRRGDSAYVIVEGPTWKEAEANAVDLGGHLVTINTEAENQWLVDTFADKVRFNGKVGDLTGDSAYTPRAWIGLNDFNEEGTYEWSSGQPITFFEPEPWQLTGTDPTWGSIYPGGSVGSHDIDQDAISIQLGDVSNSTSWNPGMWEDSWNNHYMWEQGIAEIPLATNNDPTGTPTLTGDFKVGQTVSIDDSAIEDNDNFVGWTPTHEYSWEVSADNGNTWSALSSNDATDGNNSYTTTASTAGKQLRGVVSYLDGYGTKERVESRGNLISPTSAIRGNSLYSIVNGPSRDAAEEQANKLGGTLTAINSESENNYIVDQLGTHIEPVSNRADPTQEPVNYKLAWIGLEKDNQNNAWGWSNGEPLTYTNWTGAGPSGGEPFGDISLTKLTSPPATGARAKGDWNDAPNDEQYLNYIAGGIAEIPFIRRDDSAYVIVEGDTWAEAQANAVALGGNLTTINDEAENEWITQLINQRDTTTAYWIGLNDQDENETYTWINGETSSYRAWDANGEDGSPEPSGNTYGAMFGKPEGLNYSFKWIEEGSWYSLSENIAAPLQAIGGSLAGIAEIPLVANQTPSGQPELEGALEVGQTLRIDPSKINDNDNSEYWSPTYHYSWEVSNNQGKSWTPLDSRDANDGNATLTLTSNEVGLQLRGRASYLDGMGTKESLTTTASSMGRFRLSADQSNHAGEP